MSIHKSLTLGTHISLTIHNESHTLHTTVYLYMNEIKNYIGYELQISPFKIVKIEV